MYEREIDILVYSRPAGLISSNQANFKGVISEDMESFLEEIQTFWENFEAFLI
jgi:hypothetical protein